MMLNLPHYKGTKTGVTDSAGPCLACTYENGLSHFVIILLNSKSMEERWKEIPKLVEWATKRQSV
jgi:D-alanyl-D-alanine carboxypeptidase